MVSSLAHLTRSAYETFATDGMEQDPPPPSEYYTVVFITSKLSKRGHHHDTSGGKGVGICVDEK